MYFDSLFDLITHYQSHPLRSSKFSITLGKPAPPTNPHEDRPWFHAQLSRSLAEDVLSSIPVDGAFLVRQGERVSGRGNIHLKTVKISSKNVLKKLTLVYKVQKRLSNFSLKSRTQYASVNFFLPHILFPLPDNRKLCP